MDNSPVSDDRKAGVGHKVASEAGGEAAGSFLSTHCCCHLNDQHPSFSG